MRLTGGAARGRRLPPVRGRKVRPTPAIIREAIFNILPSVENTTFLDLFAGSGIVGLEALSRGARKVLFVEKDPAVVSELKKNIFQLGYADRSDVLQMEANRSIDLLLSRLYLFDVVFLDPPYHERHISEILTALAMTSCGGKTLLSRKGWLVIQHSRRQEIQAPEVFTLWKIRNYGESQLSIFQIQPVEE